MSRFFTSDLHFGHKRVIEFCSRPWPDVFEMNEGLIERWNDTVGPDDDVWILGDLTFVGTQATARYMKCLNGRKHLLRGNHDWKRIGPKRLDLGFETIVDETTDIWLDHPDDGWRTHARMSHFPYQFSHPSDSRYEDLRPKDNGSWLLHGHVHRSWKVKGKMINVGVDVWDYRPVSERTIVDIIRQAEAN